MVIFHFVGDLYRHVGSWVKFCTHNYSTAFPVCAGKIAFASSLAVNTGGIYFIVSFGCKHFENFGGFFLRVNSRGTGHSYGCRLAKPHGAENNVHLGGHFDV
ncbi:hypothetical protein AA313_de0202830 [Arthrobotrys entomopaga]|nr:hypothetical protein AA313_de0202830 [Arthrobotrys entomopaga]